MVDDALNAGSYAKCYNSGGTDQNGGVIKRTWAYRLSLKHSWHSRIKILCRNIFKLRYKALLLGL